MKTYDFVVVGSGGGGGTISWLLAKAGFSVALLEQGPDLHRELEASGEAYDAAVHDEYRFRLRNPRIHRRPRGAYNTRREIDKPDTMFFQDLMGGWTGSTLGGGTVIWGTWGLRPFPLDFRLKTFLDAVKKAGLLGPMDDTYSVVDWPIAYRDMVPFFNVAEALLAVCGDREEVYQSVAQSEWFNTFKGFDGFGNVADYRPAMEFPLPPYPRTPVGEFVYQGADAAKWHPCALPVSIVNPRTGPYHTQAAIAEALAKWGPQRPPAFWKQKADDLWSDQIRTACTMCGFCGEYLCWGTDGPKSGTRVSTIREFQDLPRTKTICNARAYEVLYDEKKHRATGVAYLNVEDPDNPRPETILGKHVIVSCGAVQTARLLLMSGPTAAGLGNRSGQLGKNAMFHLFGLNTAVVLKPKYQGFLHGEFGPTGNTATYAHYLVKGEGDDDKGKWYKGGIFASTANKNPMDDAVGKAFGKGMVGSPLLQAMDSYARRVDLRITGDDLPRSNNQVILDPTYVDEYGLPVASVRRSFGPHEGTDLNKGMQRATLAKMKKLFEFHTQRGVIDDLTPTGASLDLIGDHQMGTCRMGEDPDKSVLNPHCQMHDVPNVFVVDTSFMPTGFGVNPMVTVVANALRVGTWIVEQSKRGGVLS